MAKARKKPARAPLHPFTFPMGAAYPGEAVGTPPIPLPEQDAETTQGVAPAGLFPSESELPVQAVGAYPAKLAGKKVKAGATKGNPRAQARAAAKRQRAREASERKTAKPKAKR